MRWILSILLFMSISFVCGCFTLSKSSDKNTFVLATFNIRYPGDKTPHTWKERKDRCLSIVKKNGFDIYGVQEAYRYQLNDLVEGDEFAFIGGGRDDFKDKGEFSAIIYRKDRFELLKGGTFGLSEKPDVPGYKSWGTACPRIATWGLFQDRSSGIKFVYYNTHLDHVSALARSNGIKLLVEHAEKNATGFPLIISGDFNASPTSDTYATAAKLLLDAKKVSMTPHEGPEQTFHKYGTVVRDYPIDYIFVSKDIKVLSHKTEDARFEEGFASDHYPVVTKLLLD